MKKNLPQLSMTAILILSLLVGLFAGNQSVNAQDLPATVDITVNKKQQAKGSDKLYDNNKQADVESLKALASVKGAGFTVYNVTEKFYKSWATAANKDKDAKTMVADFAKEYTQAESDKVKDEQITDIDGKTIFTDFPLKTTWEANGTARTEFSVYFFAETTTPAGVIKGEDFIVALPIVDQNAAGEEVIRTAIDVYPKNQFDSGNIELEKRGSDNALLSGVKFTLQNGKGEYYTGGKTPNGIAEFKAVTAGETIPTIATVNGRLVFSALPDGEYTLAETEAPAGYKISFSTKEFTVTDGKIATPITISVDWANETGKPQDYVGKNKVAFTNGEQQADLLVENKAIGQFAFTKVDAINNEKGLAGAEFVVTKGNQASDANEELYYNSTTKLYKWTSEVTAGDGFEKVLITTDANGKAQLQGLHLGTYYLKEIKAPTGYILPNNPYTAIEAKLDDKAITEIDFSTEVVNVQKGSLPSTGGKGIYAFLIIGAALMLTAVIVYQKTKKTVEV